VSGAGFETVETRVCGVEDVPLHEGRAVRVDGRRVAVFRTDSGWHAVDDVCSHMGGPLSDGMVAEDSVSCPLHERRFDLRSGRAIDHECGDLARYPVELRGEDVFLLVPVSVEGEEAA
jgi:NAD(P)H-dependent nitrite reductase small subunit